MQAANQPTESVVLNNTQIIDTWNQERTLDQLQAFIHTKNLMHDTFDDIDAVLA
ncbi:MAG TPA: hypothetical protein VGE34_03525 [Candidatus Saccharimonadales bacterium]